MTDSGGELAGPRPPAAARLLLALITGYRRFISPLIPPRCRFAPSCSAYALQAVAEHGAARGAWLAVRRVGRCHPFNPGGYDPVPPRRASRLSTPVQGS
jgi:putative membrane protein insertion efficiency factor